MLCGPGNWAEWQQIKQTAGKAVLGEQATVMLLSLLLDWKQTGEWRRRNTVEFTGDIECYYTDYGGFKRNLINLQKQKIMKRKKGTYSEALL